MHVPVRGNSVPSVTVTLFSRALEGAAASPLCRISAAIRNNNNNNNNNKYYNKKQQQQQQQQQQQEVLNLKLRQKEPVCLRDIITTALGKL